MAKPTIIKKEGGVVFFTLSNKPELECKADSDNYYNIIHNTNCWYIHEVASVNTIRRYIRRNVFELKKWSHTEFLHSLVVKKKRKNHVIDHIFGNTLDNRREVLRSVTVQINRLNTFTRGYNKDKKDILYKGVAITKVFKKDGKTYYQSYRKGVYFGCRNTLAKQKKQITERLEKLKCLKKKLN